MSSFSQNNQDIIEATKHGHVEMIKILIINKIDINFRDNHGMSAISWAAKRGYIDIAQILLDNGADPNIRDVYGWTPINWAIQNGHFKIVKLLKKTRALNEKKREFKLNLRYCQVLCVNNFTN